MNETLLRLEYSPKKVRKVGKKALREPLMVPEHLVGHPGDYTLGKQGMYTLILPQRQPLESVFPQPRGPWANPKVMRCLEGTDAAAQEMLVTHDPQKGRGGRLYSYEEGYVEPPPMAPPI